MKQQRIFNANGVEVTTADLNQIGFEAGTALDNAVSEFFRLQMRVGAGAAQKGVVPFSTFKSDGTNPQTAGIVTSSGNADRTIYIYPFLAAVAATAEDTAPTTAWENTRTVEVVPSDSNAGILPSILQLATTDGTHSRCDLVWVKVSISSTTQSNVRFVRDPTTGVVSSPTEIVEISDTYSLGVTPGTTTTTTSPARPTIPADTASDFYIPLAYIFIPPSFGATAVNNKWIQEVAPALPISRATGSVSMRPASWHHDETGPLLTQDDFNTGGGGHRAIGYAPSSWVGGEKLIVAASWNATGPVNIPQTNVTNHVIDNSCDWRRRIFFWQAAAGTATSALPWDNGTPRASGTSSGFGQSFVDDGTGLISIAGGVVAHAVNPGSLSSAIDIYVNLSDGTLRMNVPATNPNGNLIVRIEASGQLANSS